MQDLEQRLTDIERRINSHKQALIRSYLKMQEFFILQGNEELVNSIGKEIEYLINLHDL